MKCASCNGQTRKYSVCGKCVANFKRGRRLAEKARKQREKRESAQVRKAA